MSSKKVDLSQYLAPSTTMGDEDTTQQQQLGEGEAGDEDGEGETAELIYEDEGLRREYEEARVWLDTLTPRQVLKSTLFDDEEIAKLAETYKNNTPYPHLVIGDFIDADILDRIADEIRGLEWKAKNNDLYLFHQSKLDLKATRLPLVKKLCQVLYSDEFVSILKRITGLPLFIVRSAMEPLPQSKPLTEGEGEVDATTTTPATTPAATPDHPDFDHIQYSEPDMFSAVYGDTCRLLCHDDELEGRRIAYILYLTKEWIGEWGGHLDLFGHTTVPSSNGKQSYLPTHIEKSYSPQFAQFAFFEVSETSFHQVREVYRTLEEGIEDDGAGQRFSISGWYHGPHIVRQNDEYVPSSPVQLPPQNATTMKPITQFPFNQSGLSQEQIDAKNAELLKQWCDEKLLLPPPVPSATPALKKKVGANTKAKAATPTPAATPDTTSITTPAEKPAHQSETKIQIEENIKFWVEKSYLAKSTQKQVIQRFEEDSSLDLVNFIKPSVYNQLLLECWQFEQKFFAPSDPKDPSHPACDIPVINESSTTPIQSVGPCNLRVYYRYNPQNVLDYVKANPDAITAIPNGKESLIYKFIQFLHSKSFFALITMLTGMKAISSAHELQLYRPGCYTLAHDNDPEMDKEGLDVTFSLFSDHKVMAEFADKATTTTEAVKKIEAVWNEGDFGGSIHYLQAGEDDELLSVSSPSNTLSLVYRAGDEKIFQFQRYMNHLAPGSLYRFRGLVKLADE